MATTLVGAWHATKQYPEKSFSGTFSGKLRRDGSPNMMNVKTGDQSANMLDCGWTRDEPRFDYLTRSIFRKNYFVGCVVWKQFCELFRATPPPVSLTMLFNKQTGQLHTTTQKNWHTEPRFTDEARFALVFTTSDLNVARRLAVSVEQPDPTGATLRVLEERLLASDFSLDVDGRAIYYYGRTLRDVIYNHGYGPYIEKQTVQIDRGGKYSPKTVTLNGVMCRWWKDAGMIDIVCDKALNYYDDDSDSDDEQGESLTIVLSVSVLIDFDIQGPAFGTKEWSESYKTTVLGSFDRGPEALDLRAKCIVFFDNWGDTSRRGGTPSVYPIEK